MRFAFAACQQYEQGYYVAYRHMANEDLDLVIHLGDYIYESSWGRNLVRSHASDEPYTLAEYRNRYALYKSDDDLQAAHAAFPWLVTWDDHEVDNDYANDRSQDLDPPEAFLARRAAAYQAYYEHMPLPAWARPSGPDMQLYAALAVRAARELFRARRKAVQVSPGLRASGTRRQQRDAAGRLRCAPRPGADFPRIAPGVVAVRTSRRARPRDGTSSRSRRSWRKPTASRATASHYWTDGWDGYPRARERLLTAVSAPRVSNPLVLSGDVHMSAVTDLKVNFDDAKAPVVATEFVCPSISSQGPSRGAYAAIHAGEPAHQVRRRRAARLLHVELTPERCVARIERRRKRHRPRLAAAQSRDLCGRKRPSRRGTHLISRCPASARGHAGRAWSDGLCARWRAR